VREPEPASKCAIAHRIGANRLDVMSTLLAVVLFLCEQAAATVVRRGAGAKGER